MLIFLLFLLFTQPVYAQTNILPVIINEVQIEPLQQVELVNTGTQTLDLGGWIIDDDGGSTSYTIDENTFLDPKKCIVITGNFNLNKSSKDTVRVFDSLQALNNPDIPPVDTLSYPKSPGVGLSFQRFTENEVFWATSSATLGAWNDTKELCTAEPAVTPQSTKPFTTPTQTPSPTSPPYIPIINIFISEFYPAPSQGQKEWIELYNNNEQEVELIDWYIDDQPDGGSSPRKFSTRIPALGYAQIELESGIFNNDGDSVRIMDRMKSEIDSISFEYSIKGQSIGWEKVLSAYYCNQQPSPGAINNTCVEEGESASDRASSQHALLVNTISEYPSQRVSPTLQADRYFIQAQIPHSATLTRIQAPSDQSQTIAQSPESITQQEPSTFDPQTFYALLSIISIAAKIKVHL